MASDLVKEQLKKLPYRPGVYLFRDAAGTILYVGKAAVLRNRVRSYFHSSNRLSPKLEQLVARVADIDYFVTSSEQEALILELNLIKRHHPRYNVQLKDDKTFPYLKIDTTDPWPRIYITRRMVDDGSRYFGPYASAWSVRQVLKVIKELFPLRTCTKPITGADRRACLAYDIGDCPAPCTGAISEQQYAGVVQQIVLFLEGKQEKILKQFESEMEQAAAALEFEKAALYRDRIQAIHQVIEGQQIAAKVKGEQDVIAFAQNEDQAAVQVFFIRNNKLIGRESFTLQGTQHETPPQIMTSFVQQFYASSAYVPPRLLLQYPVDDADVIRDWLRHRRGGAVRVEVPQRGPRKQLMDNVAENARHGLEQLKIRQLAASSRVLDEALAGIATALKLPGPPQRIEAYDISNIQGKLAVGSMVVFDQGRPRPAHYRRFQIKTVSGANDYAMLQEVLKRRFKRGSTSADAWAIMPDLVLIDGGKGQLNAAVAAVREAGADSVPVVGLAKENEELFLPRQSAPIVLPRTSPALQMLQRVRDEAHRFAIGYHQKVRRRETFVSALDGIAGVGPRRKRALLRKFGAIDGIRQASVEELAAVDGMTRRVAQKIKEEL